MEEESENIYFGEMGMQRRTERDTLSFMRKSNLLSKESAQQKMDEEDEEDPLDAYMREIE